MGSGPTAVFLTASIQPRKQGANEPIDGDLDNLSRRRKAVVLGHGDTALGVVQAMAQAGIKVVYASTGIRDHARFSRFISDRVRGFSSEGDNRELLRLMLRTSNTWDGALLMPCDDVSVSFVSRNRDALVGRYVPTVQGWNVIKRIMNKRSLYLHAREINIPLPKVWFPDSIQSLAKHERGLCYPCLVKPYESHRFFDVYQKKLHVVHHPEALIEKFCDARQNGIDVMVSEIVPGKDDTLFNYHSYLDSRGDVLAEMCLQKLRQHPVGFGVSCLSKTVPMIGEIRAAALRLLKSLGYRGLSTVEFKHDNRDNQYKLMEINVRPVLQERLCMAAGMNLSFIAYLDLVEGVKQRTTNYRLELYWQHDFLELIRLLHHRNLTLKSYLWPRTKNRVACVPLVDDPLPFVVKAWHQCGMGRAFVRNLFS